MVRGKPLSNDLRAVILNMACHLDVASIAHYTGCPIRTTHRLLSDYRHKGTVVRKEILNRTLRGRKRALTSENIHVCAVSLCISFSHCFDCTSFFKVLYDTALMSI
jgi:hypothetical protein